jgi:hypothetical protein
VLSKHSAVVVPRRVPNCVGIKTPHQIEVAKKVEALRKLHWLTA